MLWYLLRHSIPATIQSKMLQQASSGVKSSSYFDVRAFDSSLYGIYIITMHETYTSEKVSCVTRLVSCTTSMKLSFIYMHIPCIKTNIPS